MRWDGRLWDGSLWDRYYYYYIFQSHTYSSSLSLVVAVLLKEEVYGKRVEGFLSFSLYDSFEEEQN